MLALAAAEPNALTAAALAADQQLPPTFLKTILSELRGAELIVNQRGPERGYRLIRSAAEISVGEILRVVDGPLSEPQGVDQPGSGPDPAPDPASDGWTALRRLQQVWQAADSALRGVVDKVTLADLISGRLPAHVRDLAG
jgi:Rrf2 family protein